MRRAAALVMLTALLAAAGCGHQPPQAPPAPPVPPERQPQQLPTETIRIGGRPWTVEVADEPAEHEKGMMFRRTLGPDELMLFIFEEDRQLGFWMKNTPVDLDIAYIGSDGRIREVKKLWAFNLGVVPSGGPVRYALEAPRGWFAAHGYGPGTLVEIPPQAQGGDGR